MNRIEGFKECLDLCCGYRPIVEIESGIVIFCAICGDGVEVEGTNPQSELEAMLQWNHKIRNKKQ